MNCDPISDYLTRIRNANIVNKKIVIIPFSKLKKNITEILFKQGYILSYVFEKEYCQNNKKILNVIKIALKYDRYNNIAVIKNILRVSKPGLRKYCNSRNIPKVLSGLGVAIISTSKGLLTDKESRLYKIGGEILFYIY